MSKDTYYFSHDYNARNDEKMIAVRMKHGAEGYGIFFMILEKMRESENYMCIKDYNNIDEGCECYTCKGYTRAYLSHLFRAKEMLAATLASVHNIYFINKLVADMRKAILEDRFFEFKEEFLNKYEK